jgi:hypothetical protein
MKTHRTVGWLAILMIITPFLAIPEWLMQTAITVLGLAVVSVIWLASSETTQQPQQGSPNTDDTKERPDTNYSEESQSDQGKNEPSSQKPIDIEDPEADTMMAADRWRKRSSRDIS